MVVVVVAVAIRDEGINAVHFEVRKGGDVVVVDARSTGVYARKAAVFTTSEFRGADAGAFAAVTAVVF